MKRISALLALSVLAVAGCSSASHKASSTSPSPTRSAYRPAIGADAALIAGHIPGCSDVAAGSIGKGGDSSLSSTATCTLLGHVVIVDSFSGIADTANVPALLKDATAKTTFADGGSWMAFTTDQGATADETTLQDADDERRGRFVEAGH